MPHGGVALCEIGKNPAITRDDTVGKTVGFILSLCSFKTKKIIKIKKPANSTVGAVEKAGKCFIQF